MNISLNAAQWDRTGGHQALNITFYDTLVISWEGRVNSQPICHQHNLFPIKNLVNIPIYI